jgi:hypothetical protein
MLPHREELAITAVAMAISTTAMGRRVVITCSVLTALVLVAEAALRLSGLGDPVLLQADASCQYLMRPNQDHFRFFVHTHINAKGMRSEPIPTKKQPGCYRLLFVGDSITYGTTYVDQNAIFSEVLHRELPAILHRSVEVLNASASTWGIGNELAYIQSRGIFDSNRVILVLNDGDMGQATSKVGDVGSQLYFEKPLCALCELAQHYERRGRADRGSTVADDAEERAKNLRRLDIFRAFVNAHGAKMIILFVPFRKDVKSPESSVIQAELAGWATQNQIPVIDATPLLAQLSINDASIDGGIHLSVKGNQAVAKSFERSVSTLGFEIVTRARWMRNESNTP